MRAATIAAATGLLLALGTTGAGSAAASDACRTYRLALRSARSALAEGKRDAALAALRHAKDLLVECRREETRNAILLAAAR